MFYLCDCVKETSQRENIIRTYTVRGPALIQIIKENPKRLFILEIGSKLGVESTYVMAVDKISNFIGA